MVNLCVKNHQRWIMYIYGCAEYAGIIGTSKHKNNSGIIG